MRRIAKRLDDTQLILVCGHNSALADELRAMGSGAPRAVVGFSAHIRYLMQLSDFFIGKPGPGSISEALQQRLPVIVVRNAWTMLQERYNTDWVEEHRAGMVLDSFKPIQQAVSTLDGTTRRVSRQCRAHPQSRHFRDTANPRANSVERAAAAIEPRRAARGRRNSVILPGTRHSLQARRSFSGAGSDRRRCHPAFPGRRAPASGPISILAAAERTWTVPTPRSVAGSAIRRRGRRHRSRVSRLALL